MTELIDKILKNATENALKIVTSEVPKMLLCTHPTCDLKGQLQPTSNFSKETRNKTGFNYWCKECRRKYDLSRKEEIKAYRKIYNQVNKEKIKSYNDEYIPAHKEEIKTQHALYYEENKEKVLEHNTKYREENQDKIKQQYEDHKEEKKEVVKEWRQKLVLYETYADKLNIYEEVRHDPKNYELMQVKCNFCKEWFNPTNLEVQNRLACIERDNKQGESRLYCSEDCKVACPVYKRLTIPKDFDIKRNERPLQKELREMVLERDNYECQKCGATNVDLVCHHITGVMQNPIESADVDNCITICKKCDKFIHSQTGCKPSDLRCEK